MLNDPKNPYRHGSALASRHDKNYEDYVARESGRKDAIARQIGAFVNPPPAPPRPIMPAIKFADPGWVHASSVPVFVRQESIKRHPPAQKLWKRIWMSCGLLLVFCLLAALA
ncbi:MAG: hypothetical protein AB7T86_04945 [Xanthobacteraceae bacterium]